MNLIIVLGTVLLGELGVVALYEMPTPYFGWTLMGMAGIAAGLIAGRLD